MFFSLCLGAIAAHAEEPQEMPEQTPPPASAVQVYDPSLYTLLQNMQATLDSIAAAVAPQPDAEQTPAPDYTAQLDEIDSTLSKIQISAEMATAETAQPAALEKPFEDYTLTETLALIGLVLLVVVVFVWFIRQF